MTGQTKESKNVSKQNEKNGENDNLESSCGIGPFHPPALQCCRNVLSFTLVYGLVALVTQTLNVYIVSQVTALEKQFNLTSTTTGIILSCNDIGFLCAVLFVSHFGRNQHIPRIISSASFLFGISGILASLCHFLDPFYLPKLSDGSLENITGQNGFVAPLCIQETGTVLDKCNETSGNQGSSGGPVWPIWLLGISMVLQGIGKSPRNSLSTTYIDNNNPVKTKTGLYLGISMAMQVFGPAMAIALGGVFRSIPVDLQETDLTPKHPKWIGAWWLGFLIFGIFGIIVGIPLLFFPKHILPEKHLTDYSQTASGEPTEDKQSTGTKHTTIENVKDLPRSVFRVLKKPVYTLLLIGILFQVFVFAGVQSFGSKYIENQFMIPATTTNIMLGVQTVLTISFGTFLGGLLTSRLKLTRLGCLKMACVASFVIICLNALDFVLGCETPHIYGFHDDNRANRLNDSLDVCPCDTKEYFPVCGGDGKTYFSPCFAGCTNQTLSVYGGCSLVSDHETTAGMCETDCPFLYYYLTGDGLVKLIVSISIMPVFITLIRTVENRDKTIAMSIYQFFSSLLGFLPAPIFFGYVIDSACIIWSESCGIKGACAQYDLRNLRFRLKSTEISGRVICLLFLIITYIVLKAQGKDKIVDHERELKFEKAKKTETSRL